MSLLDRPYQEKPISGSLTGGTESKTGCRRKRPLLTANDKRNSFGQVVRDAIDNGKRDVMLNGLTTEGDQGANNVMGAASHYLARAEFDDSILAQVSHDMGAPTSAFDDGTTVELIQNNPVSHRYYGNRL